MQWEIETDNERQQSSGDDDSQKWQTRLRLTLPRLGEVEARLHVQGQQLTLAMRATSAETRELLRGGTATLRSQLEQAGLDLASLGVAAPQEKQTDVQFAE
jgi:flagellar hook-length control protein FliK